MLVWLRGVRVLWGGLLNGEGRGGRGEGLLGSWGRESLLGNGGGESLLRKRGR